MLFLGSMGETELYHDIFFKFSLGPFEVIEVEWRSMLNFAATLPFRGQEPNFQAQLQNFDVLPVMVVH